MSMIFATPNSKWNLYDKMYVFFVLTQHFKRWVLAMNF